MRSDMAVEHSLIRRDMEAARGVGSFIQGPSVHNQRIEAYWGQLHKEVAFYYRSALKQLTQEGSLNTADGLHKSSLLHVVLPAVQRSVYNWVFNTWNFHRVRTINEHGTYRPGHIPATSFQPVDREQGLILPPAYEHGQPNAIVDFEDDDELQGFLQDELNLEISAQDIQTEHLHATRDRAYQLGLQQLGGQDNDSLDVELTVKFRLHLALSQECAYAEDSNTPLADHLEHIDVEEHPQLLFVKRYLQAALDE